MIPARAYASTAIGGQYGSAVECAVETLGVSWGSLTADQQSYLFNVTTSTENMDQFAVFRNSLHEFTPSSGLGGNAYYSTLEGSMYAVVATNARRQLAVYIQGSGSGGSNGGGGDDVGIVDGNVPANVHIYGVVGKYISAYNEKSDIVGTSKNIIFTNYVRLNEYLAQYSISYIVVLAASNNNPNTGSAGILRIYASANPIIVNHEIYREYNDYNKYKVTISTSGDLYTNSISINTASTEITWEVYNGFSKVSSGTTSSTSDIGYWVNGTSGGGEGSGGGDEPVTPPVEQPTNPNGPTITGPTINVNTGGNNSSTTTVDLTPILEMLRIINDNIGIVNGNITDFETWFYQTWQNYVDWLQLWFERFGLSLDNIYAQQELVGNNIVDELREIEDVLWNIFYKPDPEYPTSTPYDDTALQGILNGMWADNNGYLNAIQNLLMQISGQIDGLDDIYTPHVGTGKTTQEQLNEDVARLKRKFPFSIPWDLYALLQFLQAPPAAPTFSFTLPYMGTLQCDLSVFDDVAAVCRWVSLLWFVAGLLACTNKLLNLMNVFERND